MVLISPPKTGLYQARAYIQANDLPGKVSIYKSEIAIKRVLKVEKATSGLFAIVSEWNMNAAIEQYTYNL